MIAFLAVDRAARNIGTGFGNAPIALRADNVTVRGDNLRYAICPVTPFLGSDEQNACEDL